jgi:ADP-heptose:LPS heptosyltransferase
MATQSVSQQEVQDVFGELHQQLKNAYFEACTIEDKDRLRSLNDAIFEIITALNTDEIRSRNAEFSALSNQISLAVDQLKDLQQDIANIIHTVAVATKVTAAIDKALSSAAGFLAA